jgi:[ribosomal protein S5]-alanine N-acetyltransferase
MIKIKTNRLLLKKPKQRDQNNLIELLNNWEVVKWLSHVPFPYTQNDARNWLQEVQRENLNLNIFLEDELIGGIGLTLDQKENYELGYWLGEEFWGRGYATEAGIALLNKAYLITNPKGILATYMTENTSSGKVLAKLGFSIVGEGVKYSASRKKDVPIMYMEFKKEKN